jgi:protocatechuate 3,4-dioxygenase beta subunit
MRKIFPVLAAFVLTACSQSAAPTPTLAPAATSTVSFAAIATEAAALPTAVASPVPLTSTSTAQPADLFAANFIALPAPVCNGPTPEQTEGPYYMPDTPERNMLFEPGMSGERLIVVGYVLDSNCQPIPGAWLDFWQADANGVYDDIGFTLRGHQFADEQGRYFLETVVPAEYPGRTEHIHVKLQAPNGQIHTSQLYFPNVAGNTSDGIFDPALIVTIEEREGYYVAYFNFVIVP